MEKSNSVPTAITFIIIVALCVGAYFLIGQYMDENLERKQEQALKEIGTLPNMNITIFGESYTAITQVSYLSQDFIKNLPITVDMNDEGINQKKGCTYVKFSGETVKAKSITRGDILLYGESCIVIATADFDGGGKYRKLGHINNMGDIPAGTQKVTISSVK